MSVQIQMINTRKLTSFSPLESELLFAHGKNYFFDLSTYYGLLTVKGNKSDDFLQGQLSCNLEEVTTTTIRKGALCNLKGRILALLDVLRWDDIHLVLPKDLLQSTQTTLDKTAAFSKVGIKINTSLNVFGLYLQDSEGMLPFSQVLPAKKWEMVYDETYLIYSLLPNLYILLVPENHTSDLLAFFKQTGSLRGSLAWHFLQLKHLLFEIYPETRGLFLPHRLDLQNTGQLSFNKGCYKGQEVIARMHYRSKPKHTLKLMWLSSVEPLISGIKLHAVDNNQEVGELVDFCPVANNRYLIIASMLFEHPMQVLLEGHNTPISLENVEK